MILTTSEGIAGHRITKTLGLVRGNTIRARHIGRDIKALGRNIVGGEISEDFHAVVAGKQTRVDEELCPVG